MREIENRCIYKIECAADALIRRGLIIDTGHILAGLSAKHGPRLLPSCPRKALLRCSRSTADELDDMRGRAQLHQRLYPIRTHAIKGM